MSRYFKVKIARQLTAMAVALVCVPAPAQDPPGLLGGMTKKPPPDFKDRKVTFNATDGVVIEADFYPVKVEGATTTPAAILIHMYPKDRSSWKSLVPELRAKGIAVLAYDIRGNGGGTKPEAMNLKEGYTKKTPALFQNAALDVLGAVDFLRQQEFIDVSRVALVGASIGCSISLDAATRTNDLRGIVCLSPGSNYFEVDSLAHIRTCAAYTPILLIAPEAEFDEVKKLAEAGGDKVKTAKYPGGKELHGTNLFDAPFGAKVKKRVVKFVMKSLGVKEVKSKEKDESKGGRSAGDGKKKSGNSGKTGGKTGGKKKPKKSDE